jgi:hypothetical protein
MTAAVLARLGARYLARVLRSAPGAGGGAG